jgi:hypothetical protein
MMKSLFLDALSIMSCSGYPAEIQEGHLIGLLDRGRCKQALLFQQGHHQNHQGSAKGTEAHYSIP